LLPETILGKTSATPLLVLQQPQQPATAGGTWQKKKEWKVGLSLLLAAFSTGRVALVSCKKPLLMFHIGVHIQ
jgi:hypothetical protein